MPPKSRAVKAAETTKKPRASSENLKPKKSAKAEDDVVEREEIVSLDFSYRVGMSDADLKKAICSSPVRESVISISLAMCTNITDAGLEIIAENLPSLTDLDISGNDCISDVGIKKIASKFTSSLKSLDLHECKSINDVCFEHIAASLSSLESLNLFGCSQITDVSVEHIAKIASLTFLDLTKCHEITDAGLRIIGEKLPALEYLSVRQCDRISNDAKEKFKKLRPKCQLRH